MIKVSAVLRELCDGHVTAGADFYYTNEGKVVLYQTWEHMASGRVYQEMEVSYRKGDFMHYWNENEWDEEYKIEDVEDLA